MRNYIFASLFAALIACSPANVQAEPQSVIDVTRSGNADGRTVLLVPGLASSAAVWDAAVPLLEADYDVRSVQVAGFAGAQSVPTEGAYTDAIAAALVAELQTHPANNAVLIGHSMGGFVSIKAALSAPDLVDELVIVDSVPFLAGLFFPGATPEMAAAQAPIMAAQMAAMSRGAFDAQQKAGLGRLVKTQDFLPVLEGWGTSSDQAIVSAVTGEIIGADLRADLAGLETETLIMVPYDELMGRPSEAILSVYETQYAAAPNARFEVFESSLHFIMIDQPDAFHTSLRAALSD